MATEVQKIPDGSATPVVAPKENDESLSYLMKLAEPLLQIWTTNENEKHLREVEYQTHLLQVTVRQNRLIIAGVLVLFGVVLVIAGGLFYSGRDASAKDLIQLVVGLAGAAFGGYGWAMGRRRVEKEDE